MATTPDVLRKFRILTIFAAVIAALLVHHDVMVISGLQEGPSQCSLGELFDCDKVARSPFSQIFGIPVASIGLLYYLTLLFITFHASKESEKDLSPTVDFFLFCSFLSLIPTVYLASMSAFVIGAFCPYCSLLYVSNLGLFFIARQAGRDAGMTFSARLSRGAETLLSFLRDFRGSELVRKRYVQLAVFTWLATAVALYLFPAFLVQVTQVSRQARTPAMNAAVDQLVQTLKSGEPNPLALNLQGADMKRDFVRGRIDSPITVIEFADFECPACRAYSKPLKQIIDKYSDDIRFVFMDFPLNSECNPGIARKLHPLACQAALTARCAGIFGADYFWSMESYLFEEKDLRAEYLNDAPTHMNLPEHMFQQCMESPEARDKVATEAAFGNKVGVQGTPTIAVVRDDHMVIVEPRTLLPILLERLIHESSAP